MKLPPTVPLPLILIVLLGASVPSAFAQVPGVVRVLKVKAVADEAFRDNDKWEKEIREHIEWADREYRRFAGIGLELVAVERWTTHESDSMPFLLGELRHGVEKGDAEIVVGFTGQKPPELTVIVPFPGGGPIRIQLPYIGGIAFPYGDRVVVRRSLDKKQTRHTLLHEICHLFAGVHVKDKSVLYATDERTDFLLDAYNQQVFQLTRERDFRKDVRDLPRKQLDPLIDLYRKAPLRGERDFDTNIRIAYLLIAAGDVDAAIEEFEKAIEISPRETSEIIREVVVPELKTYAEEHGSTVQSRYTLGRAYATLREYGNAAQQFAHNCYGDTPHAPSCNGMGGNLLQTGAVVEAERALKRALQLDDSLADAHGNLGVAFLLEKRTADAVAEFNRALELRPGDPTVYFNMGVAYLSSGLLDPAADSFRRALELKPKSDEARSRLAVTLARQGQSKSALESIRDFEKLERVNAMVLRDMAEVFFRTGDSKKAWKYLGYAKKGGVSVTELEKQMLAGAAQPQHVKTSDLIEQAASYYDKQQYQTARHLLEQANAQEESKPEVHYWWGRVAAAEGKPDEAAEHLQQALKLKEKYPEPYLELGRLEFDRQSYVAAIDRLNQYVKLEQYPRAEAYYLLGVSFYQRGSASDAEENLRKAVQKDTDYGDALYYLGSVYIRQQRKQEAVGELNLALASNSLDADLRPEAHYRLALLFSETGKYDQAWKHVRIAQRSGIAQADQLVTELAKQSREPAEVSAAPAQPETKLSGEPVAGDQPYRLSDAAIGDSSGTLRAGQSIRGRVHLACAPEAKRQITLLLKLRVPSSAYWQQWLFTHLEIPEGFEEGEIEFMVPWASSLSTEGEIIGALSVVAPIDPKTFPPQPLSNEVQVSLRVVP